MIGTPLKMITYILKTNSNEYYCGKTNNLQRRIQEHKFPKKCSWFFIKNRRKFKLLLIIYGDYEKNIKSFGIEQYYNSINNINKRDGVSLS